MVFYFFKLKKKWGVLFVVLHLKKFLSENTVIFRNYWLKKCVAIFVILHFSVELYDNLNLKMAFLILNLYINRHKILWLEKFFFLIKNYISRVQNDVYFIAVAWIWQHFEKVILWTHEETLTWCTNHTLVSKRCLQHII